MWMFSTISFQLESPKLIIRVRTAIIGLNYIFVHETGKRWKITNPERLHFYCGKLVSERLWISFSCLFYVSSNTFTAVSINHFFIDLLQESGRILAWFLASGDQTGFQTSFTFVSLPTLSSSLLEASRPLMSKAKIIVLTFQGISDFDLWFFVDLRAQTDRRRPQ